MKIAHTIKLSVFAYEHEDAGAIRQTLLRLVPFDLAQEKLELKHQTAQGFQERKIQIFELVLKKENHTTRFLKSLKEHLAEDQRKLLLKQAKSRLDAELNFFIRLDKPNLLQDDRYWITDEGNCFHIKMNIAAYPKNRESALGVVRQWLER